MFLGLEVLGLSDPGTEDLGRDLLDLRHLGSGTVWFLDISISDKSVQGHFGLRTLWTFFLFLLFLFCFVLSFFFWFWFCC